MRILLVEDDPTTSKSIELMLGNANLNVYATDLGEEGIDLAKLYDYTAATAEPERCDVR
jgi:two-component system, cell cycle response regulator CtrA